MKNMKHTPTPWEECDGFIVGRFLSDGLIHDICDPRCAPSPECSDEINANTEFILRAVNNHEALMDFVERFAARDCEKEEGCDHCAALEMLAKVS